MKRGFCIFLSFPVFVCLGVMIYKSGEKDMKGLQQLMDIYVAREKENL